MAKAKNAIPEGYHTVTPQLVMDDAAKAIDWYKRAFGAIEVARAAGPDGKIMHATVRIGNSLVMLNDEIAGAKRAKARGGSPASMWVYVDDCDALFDRAIAAGAREFGGPMGRMQDQFWGDRCGMLVDPEGYSWTIATHKEDLTPQETQQRQEAFMKNFSPEAIRG